VNKNHIVVENIVVDVVKKDIRNLHLRVLPPNGRVMVSAPVRLNDHTIKLFVMSKISWIRKHRSKFEGRAIASELEFVSGETHYFEGRPYVLNVIYHDAASRVELSDDGFIDLYVRFGSDQAKRGKVIEGWYRECLKVRLSGLIMKWEYIIGVEVSSWSVRKMRTRWGSCMVSARKVCFNLQLARKPLYCIEFIVAHELTHLIERGHNGRFYTLMDRFMPEWRHCRDELNGRVVS
jgi:predicted metal-dependent hydrolase